MKGGGPASLASARCLSPVSIPVFICSRPPEAILELGVRVHSLPPSGSRGHAAALSPGHHLSPRWAPASQKGGCERPSPGVAQTASGGQRGCAGWRGAWGMCGPPCPPVLAGSSAWIQRRRRRDGQVGWCRGEAGAAWAGEEEGCGGQTCGRAGGWCLVLLAPKLQHLELGRGQAPVCIWGP